MAGWMQQSLSEPGPTGLNKPTQKKVPNGADCGCDPSLMTKDRTECRSFTLQIDPPPTHTHKRISNERKGRQAHTHYHSAH